MTNRRLRSQIKKTDSGCSKSKTNLKRHPYLVYHIMWVKVNNIIVKPKYQNTHQFI